MPLLALTDTKVLTNTIVQSICIPAAGLIGSTYRIGISAEALNAATRTQ
jgi:hypothetical protein